MEELGDLLYQVIFHAQIAKERNRFTINDVLKNTYTKLKRRHPHVFGKIQLRGSKRVLEYWYKQKIEEAKEKSPSILSDIPYTLPALERAMKVQRKVSMVGFDWRKPQEVLKKVEEELKELKKAIKRKKASEI